MHWLVWQTKSFLSRPNLIVSNVSQGDAPPNLHGPCDAKIGESVVAVLEPLCDTLESGVILVDHEDKIMVCSLAMAMMFGGSSEEFVGMTVPDFNTKVLKLMDDPPQLLVDKGMFPITSAVLCEEFEVTRPSRTVARWIARKVHCRFYSMVAVATDITADVDLTNAYERMALTDRLTGMSNRRGVEREIRHELLRLRRYQTPISFIIFDIDHFKNINDQHGHGTGDEVLRMVAKAIGSCIRETDLAARWGGEEFLVVLPETSYSGALVCAEKIREAVQRVSDRVGFPVSISGGVHQPGPGETFAEILTRTDGRLYLAKNQGRNRTC
jgi:diguanylate cyclase (GGDEF)-like protein